jgi:hypothetical protein
MFRESEVCHVSSSSPLVGSAEHQGLVDVAEADNLGFSGLQPQLELVPAGLDVADVAGSTIEQGNFAGLLV